MNTTKCFMCGIKFVSERSSALYCSKGCSRKSELLSRKMKTYAAEGIDVEIRNCFICSSPFVVSKTSDYQKHCTDRCLNSVKSEEIDAYKELLKGKTFEKKKFRNHSYKDKTRFGGNKYKVLERDGYKCVECGKDNPKSLIIHHKDHSGASENPNNDMDNLKTLCRSCHMLHHSLEDDSHVMYHRRKNRISIPKNELLDAISSSYTGQDAADYLKVTRWTFSRLVKLNGIDPDYKNKACNTCGTLFKVTAKQEYCSKKCWPSLG